MKAIHYVSIMVAAVAVTIGLDDGRINQNRRYTCIR
jgi:hypothetical protein